MIHQDPVLDKVRPYQPVVSAISDVTPAWYDAEDTSRPAKRGDRIATRYELMDLVGSGGFGEVWKALNLDVPGQTVAIKLLHVGREFETESLLRFKREAKALALAKHDHIVAIHEFGVHDGRQYLVTEFIEGRTLRAYLQECVDLNIQPTISWVREVFGQICNAVASLHVNRDVGPIVHRDLKPDNIMVISRPEQRPHIKILDLGLARMGDQQLTRTGIAAGTPEYMAPEQWMGNNEDISPRTDVFSLAIIFVELLTLQRIPEPSSQWWALSMSSSKWVLHALHALPTTVPTRVLEVLATSLDIEPQKRPAHAAAFHERLERAWTAETQISRGLHALKRWIAYRILFRQRQRRRVAIASSVLMLLTSLGILLWPRAVEQACAAGSMNACVIAADKMEKALPESADFSPVVELYDRACNGGFMPGCTAKGDLHANGRGLMKNDKEAEKLYVRACASDMRACFQLGNLIEEGRGNILSPEPGRAQIFYQRACKGGYARACQKLETLQ